MSKSIINKKTLCVAAGAVTGSWLVRTLAPIMKNQGQDSFKNILKNTAIVRLFGFAKIPMIYASKPIVEQLNDDLCIIRIPNNRTTQNHLKSMYFGVLAIGADLAGGLIAMELIKRSKKPVSLQFKDMKADFKRRASLDVLFICQDGPLVKKMVQEAIETGERINKTVKITAIEVGQAEAEKPVAEFELTLSLKMKSKK